MQGEEEESEEDADYAPDLREASDVDSSSDSDANEDSGSDTRKKPKKAAAAFSKSGATKKQVQSCVRNARNLLSTHVNISVGDAIWSCGQTC